MNKITIKQIIEKIKEVFLLFGTPSTLVSDNDKQFVSCKTEYFLKKINVHHYKVAFYSPSQNGFVESFNRILKEKLDEAVKNQWNLAGNIHEFVFNYRSTPHSLTRISTLNLCLGER